MALGIEQWHWVNMSDSYFGRQQYVIYCSQLRATPSADCNISHIAAGLSNYLILSSHHPSMHKRAVIKSLLDRGKKIPTTKSDQSKEKQRVISTLQSNGYPKRFILDANKPKPPLKDTINAAESGRGCITIPYVSGTSEPIKRVL